MCALIAAFGVEHVVTTSRAFTSRAFTSGRTRAWWVRVAVGLTFAAYMVALAVANERHLATQQGQGSWVLAESVVPALLALAVLAIVFGMRRWGPKLRSSAIVAIPVLLAVESLLVTTPWLPRVASADYYPQSGSLQFLEQQLGHERFAAEGLLMFPSTNDYYGLRAVSGHSFIAPSWHDLVQSTSRGTFSLPTVTVLGDSEKVATSPVLDLLAAKYFVSSPDAEPFGTLSGRAARVRFGDLRSRQARSRHDCLRTVARVDFALVGATQLRGSLDYLDVTVRDSQGKSIATGSRRLLQQAATQTVSVAIPGEGLSATREPAWVEIALGLRPATPPASQPTAVGRSTSASSDRTPTA